MVVVSPTFKGLISRPKQIPTFFWNSILVRSLFHLISNIWGTFTTLERLWSHGWFSCHPTSSRYNMLAMLLGKCQIFMLLVLTQMRHPFLWVLGIWKLHSRTNSLQLVSLYPIIYCFLLPILNQICFKPLIYFIILWVLLDLR